MFTKARLDSVVVEVVSAEAAALMARVVGKGDIDFLVTLNTDGFTLYRGAHIKGVGTTVCVNMGWRYYPMRTKDFDARGNSPFFTVGEVADFSVVEAAMRYASQGMVEVSFMLRELR